MDYTLDQLREDVRKLSRYKSGPYAFVMGPETLEQIVREAEKRAAPLQERSVEEKGPRMPDTLVFGTKLLAFRDVREGQIWSFKDAEHLAEYLELREEHGHGYAIAAIVYRQAFGTIDEFWTDEDPIAR